MMTFLQIYYLCSPQYQFVIKNTDRIGNNNARASHPISSDTAQRKTSFAAENYIMCRSKRMAHSRILQPMLVIQRKSEVLIASRFSYHIYLFTSIYLRGHYQFLTVSANQVQHYVVQELLLFV